MDDEASEVTVFEAVGGEPFFVELVDRFYAGVEGDPVLRPLYPDELTEPKRHLAGFLAQLWGGPPRYSEERGHPRLRMRHLPFTIGPAERDAWLRHMRGAIEEMDPPAEARDALLDYFAQAADFLMNAPGEGRIPLRSDG
jgi:hemoglobin